MRLDPAVAQDLADAARGVLSAAKLAGDDSPPIEALRRALRAAEGNDYDNRARIADGVNPAAGGYGT